MPENKKFFKTDIGKAISSGYFLFFLNNVVALFLTPYILKYVSKEEYGLYVLCIDFLSWMMFLEFGSSKVMESKAAHLLAVNDEAGLVKSFNSALFFQLFIALIIIPIFYFLVSTGLNNHKIPNLQPIIIIFSFSAALSAIRGNFSAMLIASRKIHIDNKIQVFINVLNYALIILLVPFIGLWGLAAITLLVAILILIRSYKRVFQMFPYLKINRKSFNKAELMTILSQGIYFSIASIATMLITKFDSFFLGKTFGLETVAKFYISIKLFSIAEKLFSTLINNIRPYISNFYGRKNITNIYKFYNLSVPVLLALSFIIFSVLIIIDEIFIKLWVGNSFFIGKTFITLFALYSILNLLALPARIVLTSTFYNLRLHSILRVVEGVLRLSIILLFIKNANIIILPLSSIISSFLLGFIGLHIILISFFKLHNIKPDNKYCFILIGIIFTLIAENWLFQLQYTPWLLLTFGCIACIYLYTIKRKELTAFIHLLKADS